LSEGGATLALLGVLAMAHPSDELAPAPQPKTKYAPGVLIVKFKEPVADELKVALVRGEPLHQVSLTRSLDALNAKYGLKEMRMLFSGFEIKDENRAVLRVETMEEHIERIRQKFPIRAARGAGDYRGPDLANTFVLQIDLDLDTEVAAADYAAQSGVDYAHADYAGELAWVPNDPYYHSSGSWGQYHDDLWGIKRIRCGEAWDLSRGSGVLIAVIDSGIWYRAVQHFHPHWEGHPDIRPNLWMNYYEFYGCPDYDDDHNGYIDDIWGWNFVDSEGEEATDPIDKYGHGTHVAGTAAAVGNNSTGIIGVAPEARVMNVKSFKDKTGGQASWASEGIVYAVDQGADVLNCSWGFLPGDEGEVEAAVSYAYCQGCAVVASAGNENQNCLLRCPAWMKQTLTIAATNVDDNRAPYSNWGVLIDVAAPGGVSEKIGWNLVPNVLSLRHAGLVKPHLVVGDENPPVYRLMCGTSMAAPHVAGTIALMLSWHPTLNLEVLRQCIRKTAVDLGEPGFDEFYGFGRLDAKAALDYLLGGYACQALLLQPKEGEVFVHGQGQSIEVHGIADGAHFRQWVLQYTPKGGPYNWVWVDSSYEPRNSEYGYYMGSVDVDDLAEGAYLFMLSVYGYYMEGYHDYVSISVSSP
jgi:subtilisin family serine protease